MSSPEFSGSYWPDEPDAGRGAGYRPGSGRRPPAGYPGGHSGSPVTHIAAARGYRGQPGGAAGADWGRGDGDGPRERDYGRPRPPAARAGTLTRDRYDQTRTRPQPGRPGQRRPGERGRRSSGAGGSGRGGGRRPGSWWRHWTWQKVLGVLGGACLLVLAVVVAAGLWAYNSTPIPTDAREAALQQSSTVYFSDGKTQVGTFTTGIDRQLLTSQQIPAVMKNAIVAAEDRNFYHEGGISITGIARAAYEDAFGSGGLQGGSTITQQFVRNYYSGIGTQQTLSRKLKEIFVAIKLAHEKPKDWILTQYLNTVFFGHNAYGVQAAAQVYFSEPASKLTVSQAAMLAAMVNQPGYFNPDADSGAPYRALVARWHYVLGNMVRDGQLTSAQAGSRKFPRLMPGPVDNGWTGYRGYIMQAVATELETTYGFRSQQQIDTAGLKIVTTISLARMKALYKTVAAEKRLMKADGAKLPWYAHIGAVLEKPGSGAILAMYGGPSYNARECVRLKCQYNMALTSRNLVGSSFKPYVLATAVHEGMNVSNSVLNGIEPMCVPPDSQPLTLSLQSVNCPAGYFPVNIAGENSGALSVPKAAAISSDPAFEDLVHRAGTQATINMAKSFGVNVGPTSRGGSGLQHKVGQVGLALGTASLTVEEQATTFATLADGGVYYTPHVIAHLSEGAKVIPIKVSHHRVLNAAQAADVDYALSFDTSPGGTGYPNAVLNPSRPTIAKTGTTDQAQSAFFIGAIPQYSLAIGMFTNSQNELAGGQTLNVLPTINGQAGGYGGAWPATIWQAYMQREFAGLAVRQLAAPDYNGFTRWVQVKPKPRPQPRPQPSPTCYRFRFRGRGYGPRPCTGYSPPPTPTPQPSPSASCIPGPIICGQSPSPSPSVSQRPPGQQRRRGHGAAARAALTAALVPAGEPARPLLRLTAA